MTGKPAVFASKKSHAVSLTDGGPDKYICGGGYVGQLARTAQAEKCRARIAVEFFWLGSGLPAHR